MNRIKAIFSEYAPFLAALKSVVQFKDIEMEVLSPMPLHDVEKLLPSKPSGVRWFAFLGGILGLAIGIGFPIYTVRQWPLITGGKPLISMPAFIIVAFELLILVGAVFTLLGLLFYAGLPRQNLANYDTRISENAFGLIFVANEEQTQKLKPLLEGADDIIIEAIEG
ncbi:DUF3341 domain-containing protein [candidate division KSB1 bacterium]|nr:DUF3341 domain-containing protein [candidate division KSB1 bacterium]